MPVLRYKLYEHSLDTFTEKNSERADESFVDPETQIPLNLQQPYSPERTNKSVLAEDDPEWPEAEPKRGRNKLEVPQLVYVDKEIRVTNKVDPKLIGNDDDDDDDDVGPLPQRNSTYPSTHVHGVSECTIDPSLATDRPRVIQSPRNEQNANRERDTAGTNLLGSVMDPAKDESKGDDEVEDEQGLGVATSEEDSGESGTTSDQTQETNSPNSFMTDLDNVMQGEKQCSEGKIFSPAPPKLLASAMEELKCQKHDDGHEEQGQEYPLLEEDSEREKVVDRLRSVASLNSRGSVVAEGIEIPGRDQTLFSEETNLLVSVEGERKCQKEESHLEDSSFEEAETESATVRAQTVASLLAIADSENIELNSIRYFQSSSSSLLSSSDSESESGWSSQQTKSTSSNGTFGLSVRESLRRLRSNVSEEGFEVNKKHRAWRNDRLRPGIRLEDQLKWPSDELQEEKSLEARPLVKTLEAVPEMGQSQTMASVHFNQDLENVEVGMDSFYNDVAINPLPIIPEVEQTQAMDSMYAIDDLENVEVDLDDFCNDVANNRLPSAQKKNSNAFHWPKKKNGTKTPLKDLIERALMSGQIQTKVSACAIDDSENVEVTIDFVADDDDGGKRILQRKRISGLAWPKKNAKKSSNLKAPAKEEVQRVRSQFCASVPYAIDDTEDIEVNIDDFSDDEGNSPILQGKRNTGFAWLKNLREQVPTALPQQEVEKDTMANQERDRHTSLFAVDDLENVEVNLGLGHFDDDEEEVHFCYDDYEDEEEGKERDLSFRTISNVRKENTLLEERHKAIPPIQKKGAIVQYQTSPPGESCNLENVELVNMEAFRENGKGRQLYYERRRTNLIALCFFALLAVIAVSVIFRPSDLSTNKASDLNVAPLDQDGTAFDSMDNFPGAGNNYNDDFVSGNQVQTEMGFADALDTSHTSSLSPSIPPTSSPQTSTSSPPKESTPSPSKKPTSSPAVSPTALPSWAPSEGPTECIDSILTDRRCYARNGNPDVMVIFKQCNPNDDDWIGVYPAGSNGFLLGNDSEQWSWACEDRDCQDEIFTRSVAMDSNMEAGWYQVFLILDSNFGPPYHGIASSDLFLISDNDCEDFVDI